MEEARVLWQCINRPWLHGKAYPFSKAKDILGRGAGVRKLFAASDLTHAAAFIIAGRKKDSNGDRPFRMRTRRLDDHSPSIVIIDNEEAYHKYDKGGYIYILPSEHFEPVIWKNNEPFEFTSTVPVTPIQDLTRKVRSGYKLCLLSGVLMYFVTPKMFDKISRAKNNPELFLKILGDLQSANEKERVGQQPLISMSTFPKFYNRESAENLLNSDFLRPALHTELIQSPRIRL